MKPIHRQLTHLLKFTVCGLLCLLSSACSINPATGSPDLVTMSEKSEIELGKKMHQKILETTPIYQDPQLQTYIEAIGQKIVKHSDRPDLTYHFTVIDDENINAFAIPGGYIYINRGLLAYLSSEAQLAAVIAHEIAHITARHSVRQDTARKGAGLLSIMTIITTGSAVLTDMSSLWSSAAVKGYGREMELEADQFGAVYLHRSGYPPEAMLETLGVLKDQEKFMRFRAKTEGRQQRSYHGLFASHPRNDQRLQTVIREASGLEKNQQATINAHQYRLATQGLVYGKNYAALAQLQQQRQQSQPKENRYTHSKLGFTLLFPDQWQISNQRSAIIGQPQDGSAQIQLEVRILTKPTTPTEYLRQEMQIPLLKRSEDFQQHGTRVHTGIVSSPGQADQRVATFFQGRKVYLFTGSVSQPQPGVDYDQIFMQAIKSFRPVRVPAALPPSKKIHYVKANKNTTFAQLATITSLGRYTEQQLRLINGYYPHGEPKSGEWIKIIK